MSQAPFWYSSRKWRAQQRALDELADTLRRVAGVGEDLSPGRPSGRPCHLPWRAAETGRRPPISHLTQLGDCPRPLWGLW